MRSALEKAQAASAAAADIGDPSDRAYQDLIVVAQLQANIAQAEALARIAESLEVARHA